MYFIAVLAFFYFAGTLAQPRRNFTYPSNTTLEFGRFGCSGYNRRQSSQLEFCKSQYDYFIEDLPDNEDLILTSDTYTPADPFYALPESWSSSKDVAGRTYVCQTEVDYDHDEDRGKDDKTSKAELRQAGWHIFSSCLANNRDGYFSLGEKSIVSIRVIAGYDVPYWAAGRAVENVEAI